MLYFVNDLIAAARAGQLPPELAEVPTPGPSDLAIRQGRAAALIDAMRRTHPGDLRLIACAALLDLLEAAPGCPDGHKLEDAQWWSGMETDAARLPHLIKSAARITDRSHAAGLRKRVLQRLFNDMSADERTRFIAAQEAKK